MKKLILFLMLAWLPTVALAQSNDNVDTPNRNIEEDSAFTMVVDYIKNKLESTENKVIAGIMILGFFLLLRYPLIGIFMIIAPGTVYLIYLKVISMF